MIGVVWRGVEWCWGIEGFFGEFKMVVIFMGMEKNGVNLL